MERLQTQVNPAQKKQVEELVRLGGALTTQRDVVTESIALLSWAAHKKVEGYRIVAFKDDDRVEFESPLLVAAAFAAEQNQAPAVRRKAARP